MTSSLPRLQDMGDDKLQPYYHYLELRTALFHFGQFPQALTDLTQQKKLQQEVLKQLNINHAVQSSSEYAMMVLNPKEIESALNEIYDQIDTATDPDFQLEQLGLSHELLREAVTHDLRVAAVLDYIAEQQAQVKDLDAELFYRMHIEQFTQPERRTARHILITINDDYRENRRSEAKRRIQQVHAQLLQQPERFEELAKANSECPTALEGGMLGHLNRGQLYPELDAVLFALEAGEIASVTESELGFHIMQCQSIEPASEIPFDQVREKIKTALRKRNQRAAQRRWLRDRMTKLQSS